MPLTPKALVVETVPSLRIPIPCVPPLPALVLPEMFRHTVVLVPATEGVPESIRMPGRTPVNGAAILLPWILIRAVPLEFRAPVKIPLPSQAVIMLLLIVAVRSGVSPAPIVLSTPTAMHRDARMLLATMTLPVTLQVAVDIPNTEQATPVPLKLVSGLPAEPLFETSKLAWLRLAPLPPVTATAIAFEPIWFGEPCPAMLLPVMVMTFEALPGVPQVPPLPVVFALPQFIRMPLPLGNRLITLLLKVALEMCATVAADPRVCRRIPDPFELAVDVALVRVFPEIVRSFRVPLKLSMSMPW